MAPLRRKKKGTLEGLQLRALASKDRAADTQAALFGARQGEGGWGLGSSSALQRGVHAVNLYGAAEVDGEAIAGARRRQALGIGPAPGSGHFGIR